MLARLSSRQPIAEGTTGFEFIPISEPLVYIPGQFFTLTLPEPLYSDNRGPSRHLGFAGLPQPDGLIKTAFRNGPSAFKRTLLEMPLGSQVELSEVGGSLLLPEDSSLPLVIIVGGIGIVPIISILRKLSSERLPHRITLIYSNTNQLRSMFLADLQEMARANINFVFKPVMTRDPGWSGETARLDQMSLSRLIPDFSTPLFYITGTPRFVPDMVRYLKQLGVEMPKLKFEIFSGY